MVADLIMKEETFNNSCCSSQDSWIFESTMSIVRPRRVLEIGFFRGGSAYQFLSNQQNIDFLLSIDPIINVTDSFSGKTKEQLIMDHALEYEAVSNMFKKYKNRFGFLEMSSQDFFANIDLMDMYGDKFFDLIFIDGDHWEDGITNDFQMTLDLKIKYVLVDDWVQPPNGPKSVPTVFHEKFRDKFKPLVSYYRNDFFQNQPIPMVLLENVCT